MHVYIERSEAREGQAQRERWHRVCLHSGLATTLHELRETCRSVSRRLRAPQLCSHLPQAYLI